MVRDNSNRRVYDNISNYASNVICKRTHEKSCFLCTFFNVVVISKMTSHGFINQGKPFCRIRSVYGEKFYIKGEKKKSSFSRYLHKIQYLNHLSFELHPLNLHPIPQIIISCGGLLGFFGFFLSGGMFVPFVEADF